MEVQSLNCSGVAAPESGDTSGRQKVSLTMKIRTLKSNPDFGRRAAAALGAGALLLPWAAQATLENRDLNGDGVVDAFYDTDLDLTWLRNANVNGLMDWATAVAWADGFSFAGYDDWRLPTSDSCSGYNCTGSEMGHLWYWELGNLQGAMNHTGSFQNLQSFMYWSGTVFAIMPSDVAWAFDPNVGDQYQYAMHSHFYAMAARAGDVPAVPEPRTCALLLAGLTGLLVARQQRLR